MFLFCLDLELFANIKKDLVSTPSPKPVFYIFINFFSFCLDLELFAKITKDLVLHAHRNQFFTFLLITQDINKIKKNSEHAFLDIVKEPRCAKFQQKILNFMILHDSWSSSKFSIFQANNLVSRK